MPLSFLKPLAILILGSANPVIPGPPTPYIDFFLTSAQAPMVGLSCSTEKECQTLCQGSESCQKPIGTCLSCIGSKSPYMNDFFGNLGDLTTACFDQGAITLESETLFNSISLIPLTPSSPYNPLSLKDLGLTLKFMSLCPAGTLEPVAVAFTDSFTHAVLDIPLMKCGKTLFPLVRLNEDCARKTAQIHEWIQQSSETLKLLRTHLDTAVGLADQLPLTYDVLQFSEFSEGHYVRCNSDSKAVCQSLCHSSLSCSIPINNLTMAKSISAFNRQKWTACGIDRFSPQVLIDYLRAADTVSFTSSSLFQSYDLPVNTGGFGDFTVINAILSEFSGIFFSQNATKDPSNSSFFISSLYRDKLKKQMKTLCDDSTDPVIFGRGNRIERVFCRSELNGYFRILAAEGETCESKTKSITSEIPGLSRSAP